VSGEFDRIAEIRRRAARRSSSVVLGIGDDAALLRPAPGCDTAISTDLIVEGVHFNLDWASAELIGHKALAVSVSDMAAMGARPFAALFSIALPAALGDEFQRRLYAGIFALAGRFAIQIVGGDSSSSPGPVFVDSVLVGEVERGRALRRSGARPGDDLWVSGTLGSSAWGLELLRGGARLETSAGSDHDAILTHLAPEPRVALGRALAERRLAAAAIDLSDGLSSDVRHLCEESHVGVVIEAAALPTHRPLEAALHGGEQFELLFASRPAVASDVAELTDVLGLSLTRIGRFGGPQDRVLLDNDGTTSPLSAKGWDHFASR
jgi:thiamine-monophosphate kinase